jgi:UDP-glucuronate 4-epimerase
MNQAPIPADHPVLITGAAGFIGSSLTDRLLAAGHSVVGVDNFCDFYDPAAKHGNLEAAMAHPRFALVEADIRDRAAILETFARYRPAAVVHLAAMAGVRPSIEQPAYYTAVNIDGTVNLLDAAVTHGVERFLFASSSSVYGNNPKTPFAETDPVDHPISPYAATKKAGELLCHTYHHLYHLPISCLRFFTVFGPRQRPDLAISKFLRLVAAGKPIPVFGDGSTSRDYTYIDDILAGVTAALDQCGSSTSPVAYRIYNLGGSHPVSLSDLIAIIERVTGRKAQIDRQPAQPGDVDRTWADLTRSQAELGYHPATTLADGIAQQWAWWNRKGPG